MSTIALDGNPLPGTDYKVNALFELPSQDLSGIGSFALSSDDGAKAKGLTVQCVLSFKEENELETLTKLAESTDENGARAIYVITNPLAKAMKIRQCKFDKRFSVTEDQIQRSWLIRFNLLEVRSVPEKQQKQLDQQNEEAVDTTGNQAHEQIVNSFEAVEG